MQNILKKIGLDGFILFLFLTVGLAYFFPFWGTEKSPIPLKLISNIGISLIFFFYGLKLSPEKLKAGLSNVRLHILIQCSTFLLFPIIVGLGKFIMQPAGDDSVWIGIYFIAALPSTVSSSVVMVSIAKGNVPAAIFNASISSLLGVFFTPIIVGLFLSTTHEKINLGEVIFDLFIQVIVPVCAGILFHPLLGKYIARLNKPLKFFDQSVILLIVYRSFSTAFDEGLYQNMPFSKIIIIAVSMFLLFLIMYLTITQISKLLKFSHADTITAAFCGSKKSLVQGSVMSNVIFKSSPYLGVILLPLMLYHTIQLISASIIAQSLSKQSDVLKDKL